MNQRQCSSQYTKSEFAENKIQQNRAKQALGLFLTSDWMTLSLTARKK